MALRARQDAQRSSSHDSKQIGESPLTRAQIPTELPLATRHPRMTRLSPEASSDGSNHVES